MMKLTIYRDASVFWRWKLSLSGVCVACSAHAYISREEALKSFERVRNLPVESVIHTAPKELK